MTTKQANRLLKLAHTLRTRVKSKYFDMKRLSVGELTKEHPCGTAACAIGHMPLAFPRQFELALSCRTGFGTAFYNVMDKRTRCYANVMNFFGITFDESMYLFGAKHSGRTPKAEAKVIEDFVRDKGFDIVEVA